MCPHPPRGMRRAKSPLPLSVALLWLFVCFGADGCKSAKLSRADRPGTGTLQPASAAPHYELLERAVPVLPDRPLLIAMRWTGEAGAAPNSIDARTDAGNTIALPVRQLAVIPRRPQAESPLRFNHWRWSEPAFEMIEIDGESGLAPAAYLLVLQDPNTWPGVGLNVGSDRVLLYPTTPDPDEPSCAPLPPSGGFDEPDPASPVAAIRRALWRRHVNSAAPIAPLDEHSLTAMLARQNSGRWCAALRDLALIDPATSHDLESLLVRTAWDGSTRFAAWPAATADLVELETILLSRLTEISSDEAWRLRIATWMSRQPDAVPWIESDTGMDVNLACANLTASPAEARVSDARRPLIWGFDPGPASVGRTTINRHTESLSDRIIVQVGASNRTLALINPVETVLPPGLTFENFWQSWTLDTWLSGAPDAPDPRRKTSILLRRDPATQRWEMNLACALDQPLDEATLQPASGQPVLDELAGWEELVGRESITVLYGFFGQPFEVLTILPDGSTRSWSRSRVLQAKDVAVQVEPGVWRVTIAMSEALRSDFDFDFAVVRMHHASQEVDCFPRPALPWRHDPGRMRVDLSRWDALPVPALPPLEPARDSTPPDGE